MAGRFLLYADADVPGQIVEALIRRGWDVIRAVDLYPEGTDDHVHFERAVREGRVLVGPDEDQELLALRWVEKGRTFPGLITWEREHEHRMSVGDFLRQFEALAEHDEPFQYPIVYFKPRA